MTVAILIPAAGASRRMRGRDKLLEPVAGVPLLARQAAVARATGAEVLVTLPPGDPARRRALSADQPVLTVADAGTGLAASLRAGVAALAWAEAVMILLADLPEIGTDDLLALIAAWRATPGQILRASAGTVPGHPVIFPRALFGQFADLSGDRGARPILQAHADSVRLFPLPGRRAITDLDTPEDWAAWRAGR
ncbi:NTP transferase domain-containing protein [Plastorhodobacter daqingensis]|uniref:NTP transferase domain-containing protein n=1 Tax=Plastorhodobacter daqingensis TaxID=1387281 RepID=A0ABW2UJH7_9RHOB